MIPIIAHRTCPRDAPENSLAGIRKAAELGADCVEIDVRLTLDRVAVLMHDWSPRRTTGFPGPVALYWSQVLRRLRLQGTSEQVPALSQAFDALPDGMSMALEIKDARAAPVSLRLIRSRQLESRVLMWSYRESALRYFAKQAPEIESALLRDNTDPEGLRRYLSDAVGIGAKAISAHYEAVNPQFVAEAHDRGLKVYSWIRDNATVAKKASYGLDGIVTDYPAQVRQILEGTLWP
jgi:glycerophosphoryl diester phosphodiesterase